MAEEETKPVTRVVITLTRGNGFIGIQAAECDPFFASVALATPETDGEGATSALDQVLVRLPEALAEAQARWRDRARNPTHDRPAPRVQPASPRTTTPARTGRQTPNSSAQQPLL